jgi:NAD-dependent dihydropyrimidine dehydrogenase PreA subunit
MAYVITDACIDIKDRSCIQECPVDCIYEGGRMLYINPEECIDCGACEPSCPTDAIYWDEELPKDKENFKRINKEFFIPIGNLHGASKHTQIHLDHPEIKEM